MADEDNVSAEGGAKKKGLPPVVLIAIVAVAVGAGGFFAGKMLTGKGQAKAAVEEKKEPAKEGEAAKGEGHGAEQKPAEGEGGEAKPAEGEKKPEAGPAAGGAGLLPLEEFTVNLNDPFGRRYTQLLISLEIESKELVEKIKKDELLMSRIRDRIFMIISAKTFNDMNSVSGKITLKEEILMQLNEIMKSSLAIEPVKAVLFSKYLIQ